ncbi:hypothetical protein IU433_15760 [Nocardia puris]|uniref:Uncharacterized protein n=2 Tax=Nocardia puris TaxID=208602 RepID=A0A366DBS5_9NOCA|nr:hypothetical protein [Nocardia puris]MBF6365861.1 hypothetical protein [Nocardia puris]MBF6460496.1 hypothetical protein [Nocardia puris]RBO87500.1 hypothetical protein DFR74_111206 [Nocardia puris]
MTREYPWLADLPDDGRAEAVAELTHVRITKTEVFVHELTAWQHTAEIYADPELLDKLRGPCEVSEFVAAYRPSASLGTIPSTD